MRYYLFNHTGSLNRGCEAIVRGTENIINNSDENCKFILSSYNVESDGNFENTDVVAFKARPLKKTELAISAIELKLKHSEKYALKKYHSPMIEQAKDCDVCLSIGGDTYCYGDNPGIRVLTEELKKNGKKVVLWGASIGEEDLTEEKLENLKIFDAIFARESLTFNLLKQRNANENIFLHADPAFCMEREEMCLPEGFTKENCLGLNVSPLIAKNNSEITKISEEFISSVLENTTLNIMLVPHVTEKDNNDYEYMLPMYEKFASTGRVAILPPDLNAKQYKGYIAKMRFFIGARTHATIAAYSSGVPTFVIGYSVKSRGIAFDLFDNEKYVVDVKTITDVSNLEKALETLINDEAEIKDTLKIQIPLQLRSAMQMGEKLMKL